MSVSAAALWMILQAAVAQLAGQVLDVLDVWGGNAGLDGQTVRLRGWLGPCDRRECPLRDQASPDSAVILLGDSRAFDRETRSAQGREVVIEGRVNASQFEHWRSDGDDFVLSNGVRRPGHRLPQLSSPRLIAILPARPRQEP